MKNRIRQTVKAVFQASRPFVLSVDSGSLPSEFRLFSSGWNFTENGKYLFDSLAAKSVMAAYKEWGVDLMIDLEHQSLEADAGAPDPTARDARGWCKLELRNGELWACDVRWTPDGAARLANKTQRYVSPAFEVDTKTKRVLKVRNVAITAMPATHNTPALVAASIGGKGMHPELVKQALDALEKGDSKAATEILKHLIAEAAGANQEPDGDEDGSADDGAEGIAPPAEPKKDKVIDPKVVDANAPPMDDGDEDEDDEKKPEKKAAYKAMRVALRVLTGKRDASEMLGEIEAWRTSHVTLATRERQLATDRAALESEERRRLVAQLVKLGAEFPSTVWADDKATTLKPRWASMPIATLRTHVAEQKAARGVKTESDPATPTGVRPPPGDPSDEKVTLDNGQVVMLSANEVRICKSQNCELKDFAALKAFRDSKKGN